MGEDFRQAFDDYIGVASRVLKAPRRDWRVEGGAVRLDDSAELRLRADYLEKGPEFGRLVEETNRVFGGWRIHRAVCDVCGQATLVPVRLHSVGPA